MGVFSGFGVWINQNIKQLLKTESIIPKNLNSSQDSEKDMHIHAPWFWDPKEDPTRKADAMKEDHVSQMPLYATDPKYKDPAETRKQAELWFGSNKKHPWNDAPATVKVKTKNGICYLDIEYTLATPPHAVEEMLTNPRNQPFFHSFKNSLTRLDNKSTKVLKKDGPRQMTQVEKALRFNILWWTITIPIHLIIDENHQTLTAKYKKEKMWYMKVFEGSWKVEPLYVDQERLCKSSSHISEEEYKKCSGGHGRIASKVTMENVFQPSSLLNVPPVSWLMRWITIKTIKNLLEDLREFQREINKSEPQ